ncbi:MAG: hypothetical protein HOJ30_09780 [Halieaceae bacterium]|jgi:lysylphosphatidylglycerol synthetase-like protein (DUF2156 family)|nr:hypothetical protein [Halieaceae bacterium]MBT5210195.1 hypothetical protein [Halieaceae bacterium]MBT6334055.1 hypothetical protein [Halieaceae bacterium]MBT7340796.1 hypothetical protein [Halieaceae bacterium]
MNRITPSNHLNRGLKSTAKGLFIFTGIWVASVALLTFGPKVWWEYHVLTTLLAIALNLLTGAMMLLAFFRHLKSMDELQRQTHLEAMALTLGITMIFTVVYGSLPTAQLLADTHPTNILFVMGITYMLAVMRIWISRTSE